MRSTPRLRFHWDELPERGAALSRLIDAAVESDRSRSRDEEHGDGRDDGEGAR
jgi:ribosome-binding factor A